MIIGVTGPICAGNNSVGDILRRRGFERLSLSDALRDYMNENHIPISRNSMRDTGDKLRKEYGHGFMATYTMRKAAAGKDYVVEAIMNPAEVTELKKVSGFYLFMVDASAEVRFGRLVKRARDPDEPKTFESFLEWEKRDLGIGQPAHGLHRAACFEMADYTVMNNGTLEELEVNVNRALADIKQKT